MIGDRLSIITPLDGNDIAGAKHLFEYTYIIAKIRIKMQ
jgi:hypothetical protein